MNRKQSIFFRIVVLTVTAIMAAGCSNPAAPPAAPPPPVLYTVTFDANEGSGGALVTLVSGQAVGAVMPADPVKTTGGTIFQGWYTKDGSGGDWGQGFRSYIPVTANLTVYARWGAAAPKRISFDVNGAASGTPDSAPVVSGEAAGPLPPGPVRAGADFGGWYTDSGVWALPFTESTTVTADITVMAKWTSTVRFNANGGSAAAPVTVITDKTVDSAMPADPVKTGGNTVFLGWFTKNGSGGDWGYRFKNDIAVTEHITVHARWVSAEPVKHTVSFNTHGGSVSPSSIEVYHGDAVGPLPGGAFGPPAPLRTNYIFAGWFSAANGGTYYNRDTKVTAAMTFHARWKCTVTFDAAGGSGPPSSIAVFENGTTGDLPAPVKNGVDFDGWYQESGLTNPFTKDTPVMANITVYAKYVPWENWVTFTNLPGVWADNARLVVYKNYAYYLMLLEDGTPEHTFGSVSSEGPFQLTVRTDGGSAPWGERAPGGGDYFVRINDFGNLHYYQEHVKFDKRFTAITFTQGISPDWDTMGVKFTFDEALTANGGGLENKRVRVRFYTPGNPAPDYNAPFIGEGSGWISGYENNDPQQDKEPVRLKKMPVTGVYDVYIFDTGSGSNTVIYKKPGYNWTAPTGPMTIHIPDLTAP